MKFDHIYQRLDTFGAASVDLPFVIEDEQGIVAIERYEVTSPNQIDLIIERGLVGRTLIHGAYEKNPKFFLPIDFTTHLSMLSFYGVEVVKAVNKDML